MIGHSYELDHIFQLLLMGSTLDAGKSHCVNQAYWRLAYKGMNAYL